MSFAMIVWLIAIALIALIIKGRFLIWNFYHSVIIWRALRTAQKQLIAGGRADIADGLKWDKKWFGH